MRRSVVVVSSSCMRGNPRFVPVMELASAHKIRRLSAPLLMRDVAIPLVTAKTKPDGLVLHNHTLSVLVGRRRVI